MMITVGTPVFFTDDKDDIRQGVVSQHHLSPCFPPQYLVRTDDGTEYVCRLSEVDPSRSALLGKLLTETASEMRFLEQKVLERQSLFERYRKALTEAEPP